MTHTAEHIREARQVVTEWLAAIEQSNALAERLALLGYGDAGLDVSVACHKLRITPPKAFLDILAQSEGRDERLELATSHA